MGNPDLKPPPNFPFAHRPKTASACRNRGWRMERPYEQTERGLEGNRKGDRGNQSVGDSRQGKFTPVKVGEKWSGGDCAM